jgi:hypothetical protein
MVYFQTKNPNMGKFFRALNLTMLIYFWPLRTGGNFMTIWYISFDLVHFFRLEYYVPRKIWQPCLQVESRISVCFVLRRFEPNFHRNLITT